jgi:hypothetical protein
MAGMILVSTIDSSTDPHTRFLPGFQSIGALALVLPYGQNEKGLNFIKGCSGDKVC